MNLRVFFMGLVIGTNNLAAALALGALKKNVRRWRILIVFGSLEFIMPLIGTWIGSKASSTFGDAASLISAVVLLVLAAISFYAATQPPKTDEELAGKITTWKGLIFLELGLGADNVVAGFGLGIRGGDLSPVVLAFTVAVFSIAYTWLGLVIGGKLAARWQNYAEFFAGIMLCILAGLSWFDVL